MEAHLIPMTNSKEFGVEVYWMGLEQSSNWELIGGPSNPVTFSSPEQAQDYGDLWMSERALPPNSMRVIEILR